MRYTLKLLFIVLLIVISSTTGISQQKYSINSKNKKYLKLPIDKKNDVTSIFITNYSDTIFPNDELLQFENLTWIGISGDFKRMTMREILFKTKFKIDSVKLSRLKKIKKIGISFVMFDKFPVEFSCLDSLEELDIRVSNLDSIPSDISKFKNLKELYLDGNKICYIHPEICKLDKLRILSLCSNNFKKFPEGIIDLPNIEVIEFTNLVGMGLWNQFNYLELIPYLRKAQEHPKLKYITVPVKTKEDRRELMNILNIERNSKKIGIETNY